MGNPGGLPNGFSTCPCEMCCPTPAPTVPLVPEPGGASICTQYSGCHCELFYHHAAGSKVHRRYLPTPSSTGLVPQAIGEVYEYRCVKMILDPALGGGVAYVGLCKDPKLVKWNAGGNTASEKILTCPDCTGGKCAVYYLRTGEAGYENYWRPVTPEEEPLKKKFSLDERGRLKIDPADLEDLQKEFVFRCFCVS